MSFGTDMQEVVPVLLEQLGNSCTLTRVKKGTYNPATGKSVDIKEKLGSFSTSMANSSLVLSTGDAQNFNLSGFDEDKVMVPYIQGYEIDDTWLYNDDAIETVSKIEANNVLIAYVIKVKGN